MKIAFCIPGRNFTGRFLESWTDLVRYLDSTSIDWVLYRRYNPNIYKARQKCLMAAKEHDPDYYMWIDSDMTFTVEDFKRLLENKDKKIISGLYLTPAGATSADIPIHYACCYNDNQLLTTGSITNTTNLISVRANGMGWMLVDKEVFTKLDRPFDQMYSRDSDDIIFQDKARQHGYASWVDPKIVVGHEKTLILE